MQYRLKSRETSLILLCGATMLSGCVLDRGRTLNVTAPLPSISNDELRQIDIAAMVGSRVCDGNEDSIKDETDRNIVKDYCKNFNLYNDNIPPAYKALSVFYRKYNQSSTDSARAMLARNGVQDAIMAAADYNCVEMLDTIGQGKVTKDVLMGAIGIAANATSVLTNGFTAKLWGTVTGGVTALNTKIDEVVLQQVAYGVLVSGIQMARAEIHNSQIRVNQEKPINEYTLELAIKDAIRYSNTCNAQVALEKVKENLSKNGIATAGDSYATKEGMVKRLEKFNKDQVTKFISYDTDKNQQKYSPMLSSEGGDKKIIKSYTQEILNADDRAPRLDKIRTMLRLMD